MIQGLADIPIDVLGQMEIGERLVQNLHNFINTLQLRLVFMVGRTERQADHLLDAAHTLKLAVLLNDALVLVFIKPIAVASGNLCHELGVELRIVNRREGVDLVLDDDADERREPLLSSGNGRRLFVVAMNDA